MNGDFSEGIEKIVDDSKQLVKQHQTLILSLVLAKVKYAAAAACLFVKDDAARTAVISTGVFFETLTTFYTGCWLAKKNIKESNAILLEDLSSIAHGIPPMKTYNVFKEGLKGRYHGIYKFNKFVYDCGIRC